MCEPEDRERQRATGRTDRQQQHDAVGPQGGGQDHTGRPQAAEPEDQDGGQPRLADLGYRPRPFDACGLGLKPATRQRESGQAEREQVLRRPQSASGPERRS